MEKIYYFEKILKENPITYLEIPSGSGRSYILYSLYSRLEENSLFTNYSSHRTPMGEFLLTILNLVDRKKFFEEKGKSLGPILRRYIHPRFLKFLENYKPEVVLNIETEISQIFNIIESIIREKNIKYFFIDNWQLYLEYNELFKILIPLISEKLNIHFFITGNDLPNFPNICKINDKNLEIPITDSEFVINEMAKTFHLDLENAKMLYQLSKGNWNNAKVILKNNFKPLENLLDEKICELNSLERKALFTITLIGKTFSTVTMKAVKDLYSPLFFFKNFINSEIIRWEYPLWRFASNDVLEIIKKKISQEEYFNIYSSFVKKLISYKYSDLWGRIAILADKANDEKTWIFSKLKEFRNSNSLQEALEKLEKIINRRKKELYLRKMSRILIETQKFLEAIDILNEIKKQNLLDKSYMVRCYSYLGRYDEAEKVLKEIIENLNLCYELPEILSNLSSYYFLRKETKKGLSLLNTYVKNIITLKTSPKYLSNYYNSLAIQNSMEGKLDDALYFYYLALENAKKSENKFSLFKVINNLGDLGRYIYGPKYAIKYNLEAFELSKNFSKNIIALSLANVINSSSQFYPIDAMEDLTQELEKLLKDINVEYFNYIGYRRLIILNINYHKIEDVKKFIPYIEKIKTIFESNILINIIKGYLGEEINWESLEREVLNTKDDQIILLYLNLLLKKELSSQIIIKEFSSELPFYRFLRGLMKGEDILSLLTYIDSMLDRWEFLDALNSYLHLIDYLEKLKDKNLEPFLYNSYFEALSLSHLLKLDHIREKLVYRMGSLYNFIIKKHMQIKVLESYLYNAIISAENEDQVLEILFRIFSDFFKDFLIKIQVGSNIIKEGNILLGEDTLKYYYTKSPFSIFLYSKETSDPYIIFLLRSFLKAFITFWERRYGLYDPLTGLYNRAYGDKRLEEAYLDYKRIKESFSVIFIDVDSLKTINDTYGHPYGDFVLQQVAFCIKSVIRQNDFAIRWGGDEFLILLRRVTYEDALKIAQRIEDKINEIFKGELGISYGIEVSSEEIENYEDIIRRADIKMYTSKYEKIKKNS